MDESQALISRIAEVPKARPTRVIVDREPFACTYHDPRSDAWNSHATSVVGQLRVRCLSEQSLMNEVHK